MIKQIVSFAKKHWIVILAVLAIVIIGFIVLSKNKERMYDYEIAGCSTCDAGDAGVLLDTEQEMYHMPDNYYSGDESAAPADSTQMVLLNPDETGAVVTDREDTLESAVYDDSEDSDNAQYADMAFAEEVTDDLEDDVVYDDSELDHVDENEVAEEENSEDDLQLIPMDESYETDFMFV